KPLKDVGSSQMVLKAFFGGSRQAGCNELEPEEHEQKKAGGELKIKIEANGDNVEAKPDEMLRDRGLANDRMKRSPTPVEKKAQVEAKTFREPLSNRQVNVMGDSVNASVKRSPASAKKRALERDDHIFRTPPVDRRMGPASKQPSSTLKTSPSLALPELQLFADLAEYLPSNTQLVREIS